MPTGTYLERDGGQARVKTDPPERPLAAVAPAPYVTIPLAATITGLTEKAIRRKIEEGKWLEGREYRRSPDGGLFISIKGYQSWVERETA